MPAEGESDMSAAAISLLDYAETLAEAARFHVANEYAVLLHERLLPALTQAAQYDDGPGVAHIAKQVSKLVKHADSYFSETVKMQGGVHLG
jgi:hypothetical protein